MPRKGLTKQEWRETLDAFVPADDDAATTERELFKPTGSEAVPPEIAAEDPKGADPLCAGPSDDAFSETAAVVIGGQSFVYRSPPQPAKSTEPYTALLDRLRRVLAADAEHVDRVLNACSRSLSDLVVDLLRNGQRQPAAGEPCPRCGKRWAIRNSRRVGSSWIVRLECRCPGATKIVVPDSLHRHRNRRV